MKVFFEETGEEREVVNFCNAAACRQHRSAEPMIVSPSGVAHEGHEYGSDTTACGKDATGPDWWHRL